MKPGSLRCERIQRCHPRSGQTIASLNLALNARGETTRQKCLPVFNRLAHALGGIAIYPCDGPPC